MKTYQFKLKINKLLLDFDLIVLENNGWSIQCQSNDIAFTNHPEVMDGHISVDGKIYVMHIETEFIFFKSDMLQIIKQKLKQKLK